MTYGEWTRMDLRMRWSIYDSRDDEPLDQIELNLDAGVEDGTYDVMYGGVERSRSGGLRVVSGKFEPRTTSAACYRAVVLGNYEGTEEDVERGRPIDHVFIEHLKWSAERKAFELHVGS